MTIVTIMKQVATRPAATRDLPRIHG